MKVLEVNGHSGSRHGGAKKSENVAFFYERTGAMERVKIC